MGYDFHSIPVGGERLYPCFGPDDCKRIACAVYMWGKRNGRKVWVDHQHRHNRIAVHVEGLSGRTPTNKRVRG